MIRAIFAFIVILLACVYGYAASSAGSGAGSYGGSITLGSNSSTIINDGNVSTFPGIAVLSDGRLLVCYSWGSAADFENRNNVVKCRTSSDQGRSNAGWSSETVIVTPPTDYTAAFGEIHILSDGTIAIEYEIYPNNGSGLSFDNTALYFNKLIVSGSTITAGVPVQVATGHPLGGSGVFSQNGPVELAAGPTHLMQLVYGGVTTYGVGAYFSNDQGATWGSFTTLVAVDGTHVNQWNETACQIVPANQPAGNAGRIYCLIRRDLPNAGGGYDLIYTDTTTGLSGWTAPSTVLVNPNANGTDGRPAILIHPNGGMAFMGRWSGPQTSYSISYPDSNGNLGTVWTPVTRLGPAATQNWYDALVVLPDHTIGAVVSQQVSSGPVTTKLVYQQLILQYP